jgi:hypothetical protein
MMYTAQTEQAQFQLVSPSLPLAVYREVAAHLRQVPGVIVELLPQTADYFDYALSQVGGIAIIFGEQATAASRHRVDLILAYYGDRFQPWQPLSSNQG